MAAGENLGASRCARSQILRETLSVAATRNYQLLITLDETNGVRGPSHLVEPERPAGGFL